MRYFIASDAAPIVEYTYHELLTLVKKKYGAIMRNEPLKIKTIGNIEKTPHIQKLRMTLSQLEKGGYPHFMLKEIFEQPKTLNDCMRGRVNVDSDNITLAGFIDNRDKFLNAKRIIITACGTSWHAAQIGMYAIRRICAHSGRSGIFLRIRIPESGNQQR